MRSEHCINVVRFWSFSGLHFPAFGLNTDICRANLSIQYKRVEMQTRKDLNTDAFHAVKNIEN